jgi:2-hydroxycyclohexanecarboxyl-CoA dehydrogenase
MERRTCVVIGGTGGIGAEVLRQLADNNTNLVIAYRSRAEYAEQLAADMRALGAEAITVAVDARKPADLERLAQTAEQKFGGIDVWINLQGALRELVLFHEETDANIEASIDVELRSVIYACKAAIPRLIARKGGSIISVGSDSGKVGSTGEAVSSACRGAIIAFSKAVARELARHNVRVNVVCPGPTDTPLLDEMKKKEGLTGKVVGGMVRSIPLRRLGKPQEVAAMVVFLASEKGAYVTGQAISVSGGLTMS